MPGEHLAEPFRVLLALIDEPPDKLRLHKRVPLPTLATARANAGMLQGNNRGLKARIVSAIHTIIIAAVGKFTGCSQETLLGLGQIHPE